MSIVGQADQADPFDARLAAQRGERRSEWIIDTDIGVPVRAARSAVDAALIWPTT